MAKDSQSALEQALHSGDFGAATPLVREYSTNVRAQLLQAATAPERARLFRNALENLERFLCLARVMRSHLAARLQAVSGGAVYHAPERHQHTWHIEG